MDDDFLHIWENRMLSRQSAEDKAKNMQQRPTSNTRTSEHPGSFF